MDDRTAIIDTVNRYGLALDTRDWTLLEEVFTPDAEADFGQGVLRGIEALRTLMDEMLGGAGPTQHLLANHRVEIEGDGAQCACLVRAFHAGAGAASGRTYELLGEYRDRLVRTPSGWRIARRELSIHHEIGSRDILTR